MLQKATRHLFSADVTARGDACYSGGRVHLVSQREGQAHFRVSGDSSTYHCSIHWGKSKDREEFLDELEFSCDCPDFETENCKHVWACIKFGDFQGFWKDQLKEWEFPEENFSKKSIKNEKTPWLSALNFLDEKGIEKSPSVPRSVPKTLYYSLKWSHGSDLPVRFYKTKETRQGLFLRSYEVRTTHLDLFSPEDRELIWMLRSDLSGFSFGRSTSIAFIHEAVHENLLKKICHTQRLFLEPSVFVYGGGVEYALDDLEFLRFSPEQARLHLSINSSLPTKSLDVRGEMRTSTGTYSLDEIDFFHKAGTFCVNNTLITYSSQDYPWIQALNQLKGIEIPAEDQDLLVSNFFSKETVPFVELDERLGWKVVSDAKPKPHLVIEYGNLQKGRKDLYGRISFEYSPDNEIFSLSNQNYVVDTNHKTLFERRKDLELEFLQDVESEVATVPKSFVDQYNFRILKTHFMTLIKDLIDRGWKVEAYGKKVQTSTHFDVSVSSGVDWFDLKGRINFEGGKTLDLLALGSILKSKENHLIPLGDGQYGLLPEDWIKKYSHLFEMGDDTDGNSESMRFRKIQGLFLDSYFEDQKFTKDKGFMKFKNSINKASLRTKSKSLRSFRGQLRDYQEEGLAWLEYLKQVNIGGILADDMGLGKTVQIIAFLQKLKMKKSSLNLIVAPKSLVFNWKEELERFAPEIKSITYVGIHRFDIKKSHLKKHDVIITTYHTLRNDFDMFSQFDFHYAILDEAQSIKNEKSQLSRSCKALNCKFRLALTGTPIENSISDLFSILDFVNPGLISRGLKNSVLTQNENIKPLADALAPMILRRTKEQVLKELPDKIESTIKCELSSVEQKEYDSLKKHYQIHLNEKIKKQGFAKSKMDILEALLRLRQAACHPALTDKNKIHYKSAKLDVLFNQIHSIIDAGRKCLVFSQFTSFLKVVRSQMEEQNVPHLYLDGQTRKRGELVHKFESSSEYKVFLISLKAGGLGLNLTSANYVFILDPWWNPAVEDQAVDRVYRMGQSNNVFSYKLISKGTVEEKILDLQKTKKKISEAIINPQTGTLKAMSMKDLNFLLS